MYKRQKPEIEFEVSYYSYLEPMAWVLNGIKYGVSIENFNRKCLLDPFFTDSQIRFMVGNVDLEPFYDDGALPYGAPHKFFEGCIRFLS
ncbi:hypothetical protein AGMMS49990_05450 [Endomicrobiia bacterium]|nr:hypothetical protein AGMMS49990_05450 [Endomicrobiia bacterium]